jgi:hypothetical protein
VHGMAHVPTLDIRSRVLRVLALDIRSRVLPRLLGHGCVGPTRISVPLKGVYVTSGTV